MKLSSKDVHPAVLKLARQFDVKILAGNSPEEVGMIVPDSFKEIPAFFDSESYEIFYNINTNVTYDERSWIILHELAHAVCASFPIVMPEELEEHVCNMCAVAWCAQFGLNISPRFIGHIEEVYKDLKRAKRKI